MTPVAWSADAGAGTQGPGPSETQAFQARREQQGQKRAASPLHGSYLDDHRAEKKQHVESTAAEAASEHRPDAQPSRDAPPSEAAPGSAVAAVVLGCNEVLEDMYDTIFGNAPGQVPAGDVQPEMAAGQKSAESGNAAPMEASSAQSADERQFESVPEHPQPAASADGACQNEDHAMAGEGPLEPGAAQAMDIDAATDDERGCDVAEMQEDGGTGEDGEHGELPAGGKSGDGSQGSSSEDEVTRSGSETLQSKSETLSTVSQPGSEVQQAQGSESVCGGGNAAPSAAPTERQPCKGIPEAAASQPQNGSRGGSSGHADADSHRDPSGASPGAAIAADNDACNVAKAAAILGATAAAMPNGVHLSKQNDGNAAEASAEPNEGGLEGGAPADSGAVAERSAGSGLMGTKDIQIPEEENVRAMAEAATNALMESDFQQVCKKSTTSEADDFLQGLLVTGNAHPCAGQKEDHCDSAAQAAEQGCSGNVAASSVEFGAEDRPDQVQGADAHGLIKPSDKLPMEQQLYTSESAGQQLGHVPAGEAAGQEPDDAEPFVGDNAHDPVWQNDVAGQGNTALQAAQQCTLDDMLWLGDQLSEHAATESGRRDSDDKIDSVPDGGWTPSLQLCPSHDASGHGGEHVEGVPSFSDGAICTQPVEQSNKVGEPLVSLEGPPWSASAFISLEEALLDGLPADGKEPDKQPTEHSVQESAQPETTRAQPQVHQPSRRPQLHLNEATPAHTQQRRSSPMQPAESCNSSLKICLRLFSDSSSDDGDEESVAEPCQLAEPHQARLASSAAPKTALGQEGRQSMAKAYMSSPPAESPPATSQPGKQQGTQQGQAEGTETLAEGADPSPPQTINQQAGDTGRTEVHIRSPDTNGAGKNENDHRESNGVSGTDPISSYWHDHNISKLSEQLAMARATVEYLDAQIEEEDYRHRVARGRLEMQKLLLGSRVANLSAQLNVANHAARGSPN